MNSPVGWKKPFMHTETGSSAMAGSSLKSTPIGIQKKTRKSSFNSLYSPYTRRRSFLSKNMLEAESLQCYKLPNYSYDSDTEEPIPSFSISLCESQGFLWNQDLFATSYQQAEAGVSSSLSMSDGSYLNDNNDGSGVDVIDVILTADDYISDIDVVTEVIKIGNEGIDENDISDSDSQNTDEELNDAMIVDSRITLQDTTKLAAQNADENPASDSGDNGILFHTEL